MNMACSGKLLFNIYRKMVYRNFVQVGRVAQVNFGEDYGKYCAIVDIRDQQCVFVDGPGFGRFMYPLSRLTLTKYTVPILRGARAGTVAKAWKSSDIVAKLAKTPQGVKQARFATRANLTDFERFSVMCNRKRRADAVKKVTKKAIKK